MRPLSSLRATMRTAVLSLPSWAAAAVETTAPPRTASRAMIAAPARRLLPRGLPPAAGTFVEAGRGVMRAPVRIGHRPSTSRVGAAR